MKKHAMLCVVPLLLSACANPKQYEAECNAHYDTFPEVFACTKDKLYNDPRSSKLNPSATDAANATDTVAYGEYLNSQLRQHLVTDAQAKEMFAQRIAQLNAPH